MTEKQSKGLDLLTEIIVLEAKRVKALNEEGADLEEYDNTEIEKRLDKASEYKGIFDGITPKIVSDIIKRALDINFFTFNDKRCMGYLKDVILEDLRYFSCSLLTLTKIASSA